jgi:hypothetical protein
MSNRTKYHNNNKITDYKYHKRRFKKNNTPYYNKKPKNNKLIIHNTIPNKPTNPKLKINIKGHLSEYGHGISDKIIKDMVLYGLNSKDKPIFNINYGKSIISEVGYHAFQNGTVAVGAYFLGSEVIIPMKAGYMAIDYGSCMVNEMDYLKGKNMLFHDNLVLARDKCIINSGQGAFGGELSFIKGAFSTVSFTALEVLIEKSYLQEPKKHFWITNKINSTKDWVSININYNIYSLLDNIHEPIEHMVDKSIDWVTDKFSKKDTLSTFKFENNNLDFNTPNYFENDNFNFNTPDDVIQFPIINDLELDNTLNMESNVSEPEIEPNDDSTNFEGYIDDLGNNLQKIDTVIHVMNIIKDFKDNPELILVEVERLIVNLKCDNCVFTSMFNIITDLIENGKFTIETFKNSFLNIASSVLDFPLSNTFNLIEGILDGKNIDKLLVPAIIDLLDLIIPGVGLINLALNIIKGIESLFSKQKMISITGIDAVYTDELKIGFFKIRHKITMENTFFDIKIQRETRHASDAKKYCESEFKKQLDYKVYQVIGIPVEFINDSYQKPTTRIENIKLSTYLSNLKHKWLDVNSKYLTSEEKKLLENFYFESDDDKNYRYSLLKKGLQPSWIYEHRNDHIIDFAKNIYHEFKSIFKKDINLSNINFSYGGLVKFYNQISHLFKDCFHELFSNHKTQKNNNPADYEDKKRNDIWEKCRDKRKENQNNIHHKRLCKGFKRLFRHWFKNDDQPVGTSDNEDLTNYRNDERTDYENNEDDYSYDNLLRMARDELLKRQQTIEYLFESAYSNFIGFMGSNLAFIDKELKQLMQKPITYIPSKICQFSVGLLQSHITRIIVDQSLNTFSLLKYSQDISEDSLIKYYNPIIACIIGISIGAIRTGFDFNNENEGYKFKKVLYNSAMSSLNTSFGCVYQYAQDVGIIISPGDNILWDKCISYIVKSIKVVTHITCSTHIISGIIIALLVNVGIRISTFLYNKYIRSKNKILKLENPKFKENKHISKFQECKPEISKFQECNKDLPKFNEIKNEPKFLSNVPSDTQFNTPKNCSHFSENCSMNHDYSSKSFDNSIDFDNGCSFDTGISF